MSQASLFSMYHDEKTSTYHNHRMSRATTRFSFAVILGSCLFALLFVSAFRALQQGTREPGYEESKHSAISVGVTPSTLTGDVVAEHLGNETAKAELGRASWRLFHTIFARFPDAPSADESMALQSYIYLFARLYPCGECAAHFQSIIAQFPPQVTSRSTAAAWGCHVHNEVNKSLGKEIFDCSNIGDFYDCGCKDDEGDVGGGHAGGNEVANDEVEPVELTREEKLQPGG